MPENNTIENDILSQLTAVIEKNISDERFGVSELAAEMNMSRSNLLRKVKKETKLSVSQLISQVRLKRGMELLRKSNLNVSEVAHQVGFSSTSYFIKCFREYYGHPPGEVGKRDAKEPHRLPGDHARMTKKIFLLGGPVLIAIILAGYAFYFKTPATNSAGIEKSIVVLPFKNDSNDSSNVYLINGLMESTLNNLQKIKDLQVISRTSAEKYRNMAMSIPEMAAELNVKYFVEGSGQKIGDQIVLNIQLIDGTSDRHLWAKQYRRQVNDIFELQEEIARNIAAEIQAVITPEEERRITRKPTEDLIAYDLYLKGADLLNKGGYQNLVASITWFKKAVEHDNKFALAYASASIAYYYLDIFQVQKQYTNDINTFADKALLYDPVLGESLLAKALYYLHTREYELALPYLEKALEYNPNSVEVIGFLADFYCNYLPNTTKYLEYALKGVRLEAASHDSVTTSFNYLRLSNAFMQTGFIDEALLYIDKSLEYYPENPFGYLKPYILFARDRDCNKAIERLTIELKKDTARLDILQELGKMSFMMRDYEGAYRYYRRFLDIRDALKLDMYRHESMRMGIVLAKMGFEKESQEFFKSFKDYADNDRSIYKHAHLAVYYAHIGENSKAIEHLKLFSEEDDVLYWILLMPEDPIFDAVKKLPPFPKIMKTIEKRFWDTHEDIRVRLLDQGLL